MITLQVILWVLSLIGLLALSFLGVIVLLALCMVVAVIAGALRRYRTTSQSSRL